MHNYYLTIADLIFSSSKGWRANVIVVAERSKITGTGGWIGSIFLKKENKDISRCNFLLYLLQKMFMSNRFGVFFEFKSLLLPMLFVQTVMDLTGPWPWLVDALMLQLNSVPLCRPVIVTRLVVFGTTFFWALELPGSQVTYINHTPKINYCHQYM